MDRHRAHYFRYCPFRCSAAFPSLAHAWIWFVLSCMGVPQYFIMLLQGLYHQCFATVTLRGRRFGIIDILSGIKQGCPASGSIFALSLDPCIRKIIFTLPIAIARLGAYADDLAVVLKDLLFDFVKLMQEFDLIARATALHLKSRKCVVIPSDLRTCIGSLRGKILRLVPAMADIGIAFCARYLGAIIGPAAHESRWQTPANNLIARARWLRSQVGMNMAACATRYSIYVFSILSFHLQFARPDSCIRQAERRAIATTLAAPFNAFPPDVVAGWTRIGARNNFPTLEILSQATLMRHACKSSVLTTCQRIIDIEMNSDDALLVHAQADRWFINSIFMTNVNAIPCPRPSLKDTSQRKFVKTLRIAHDANFRAAVHCRLRRRGIVDDFNQTMQWITHMSKTARFLPPRVLFSVVRATLNAVCTSTRFGALVPRACPFCDAPAQDKLPHFASCPAVAALLDAVSPGCPSLWKENRDTRLFLTTSVRNMREFCYHALVLDLVLSGYNGLTHGSIRSRTELRSHAIGRIRGWSSYSPRMRDVIRELFVI